MKIATKKVTKGDWWADVYEDMPEAVASRIRRVSLKASRIMSSDPAELQENAKENPEAFADYIQGVRDAKAVYGVVAWCWDGGVNADVLGHAPAEFVNWLLGEIDELWTGDDPPVTQDEAAEKERLLKNS